MCTRAPILDLDENYQALQASKYGPCSGAPGRIRTCDARLRSPALYPLSYEGSAAGSMWLLGCGVVPGSSLMLPEASVPTVIVRRALSNLRVPRGTANLVRMGLTHVDASGNARMVDVSQKQVTVREATARGLLRTTSEVVELLRRNGLPKGDALAVARIAGIAGAKRTPDLVPLCHPVALHAVTVELDVRDDSVEITATTRTADRTGVEMEAITAVMAAGLALYDMVKAVDRAAQLTDIRLVHKSGGRSGEWSRPGEAST
jgi:cyclic pyranopterin monophosphate synthase